MKTYLSAAVLAIAVAGAVTGCATAPEMSKSELAIAAGEPHDAAAPVEPEAGKDMLAGKTLLTRSATLTVTTPGWNHGADIAYTFTQYQGNNFPGLTWSKGPAATKSYAIIMQDTDLVMRGSPVLHWSVVNIPASVTTLPAGMKPEEIPAGSIYGPNYMGMGKPYLGPKTPAGAKHRYHIQVLAVDTVLPADFAPKNYAELIEPLKGHVIAVGDVVGLGQADPSAPPPPPRN